MASAVVNETNPTVRQQMYCHNCFRQFIRSENTLSECPSCHQGFIEDVDDVIPSHANWRDSNNNYLASITNTLASARNRLVQVSNFVDLLNEGRDNTETTLNSLPHENLISIRSVLRKPMTDEQLQDIPKATVTAQQTQMQCAVCLEYFKLNDKEVRQLQCNHLYHEKCIFPWVEEKKTCPVCRTFLPNAYPKVEDLVENEKYIEFRRNILIEKYGHNGYVAYLRRSHELNNGDSTSDASTSSDEDSSDYDMSSVDSFDVGAFEDFGPIVWPHPPTLVAPSNTHHSAISQQKGQLLLTANHQLAVDPAEGSYREFEQLNQHLPSTSAAPENTYQAPDVEDTSDSSDYGIDRSSSGSFRYRRFRNNIRGQQRTTTSTETSTATSRTRKRSKPFEESRSTRSCDGRCRTAEKTYVSRSTQTEDTTKELTLLTTNELTLLNRPQRMRLWHSHRATKIRSGIIEISSSSDDDDDISMFQGPPPKCRKIDNSDSSSL